VDALSYKTKYRNKATVEKEWLLVDAENQVVGRLASRVAMLLRGKHRTDFTPHADAGSNVVIINADKVRFTGKKMVDKEYIRYTGYQSGQRFTTPKELMSKKPTEILTHAIHGMLPKGRLGRVLNTNVRIFAGSEHNLEAQKPRKIDLKDIK
jgi:large subunit ribosomal protein L13